MISTHFGAGGAKRHRILKEALTKCDLPGQLANAELSRPVYGAVTVSNLVEVMLFNEDPQWEAEEYSQRGAGEEYVSQAVRLWKDRWSSQIAKRKESANG